MGAPSDADIKYTSEAPTAVAEAPANPTTHQAMGTTDAPVSSEPAKENHVHTEESKKRFVEQYRSAEDFMEIELRNGTFIKVPEEMGQYAYIVLIKDLIAKSQSINDEVEALLTIETRTLDQEVRLCERSAVLYGVSNLITTLQLAEGPLSDQPTLQPAIDELTAALNIAEDAAKPEGDEPGSEAGPRLAENYNRIVAFNEAINILEDIEMRREENIAQRHEVCGCGDPACGTPPSEEDVLPVGNPAGEGQGTPEEEVPKEAGASFTGSSMPTGETTHSVTDVNTEVKESQEPQDDAPAQ